MIRAAKAGQNKSTQIVISWNIRQPQSPFLSFSDVVKDKYIYFYTVQFIIFDIFHFYKCSYECQQPMKGNFL